jgi:hypothetical protein
MCRRYGRRGDKQRIADWMPRKLDHDVFYRPPGSPLYNIWFKGGALQGPGNCPRLAKKIYSVRSTARGNRGSAWIVAHTYVTGW